MMKYLIGFGLIVASLSALAELQVSNAQIRAVPPTQKITAAFMDISNHSESSIAIIAIETDIADSVEFHTSIREGEKILMRKVESIPVDSQSTTALEPGGYHLMLFGLKRPLIIDELIKLQLQLSNGEFQTVTVPVIRFVPVK